MKKKSATITLATICVLALVLLRTDNDTPNETDSQEFPAKAGRTEAAFSKQPDSSVSKSELREWITRRNDSANATSIEEGKRIAAKRAESLKALMQSDPDQALEQILSYQEYRDLPPEIAAMVEQPFAAFAEVEAIPDCSFSSNSENDTSHFATWNGERKRLFLPSKRSGLLSKSRMPISGYFIGDIAVLRNETAPIHLHDEASAAAELFKIDQPATTSTDLKILVGDQLWDKRHLAIAKNLQLAESLNAPDSVTIALSLHEGPNPPKAEAFFAAMQSVENEWTHSPKDILVIRAIYPDSNSDSVETASTLEDKTRDAMEIVEQFSYGKTKLGSLTVISDVYQLPHPEDDYSDGDEFEYWRVSNDMRTWANDQGYRSSNFDIVVYQFPQTANADFGGKASLGGRDHWLNGPRSVATMVHEFGHNYGLSHASAWNDTSTSLPEGDEDTTEDSDKHDEYGDVFDVMGDTTNLRNNPHFGHFHPYGTSRLGWVNEDQILRLDSSSDQTIRLYRFDHPAAGQNPLLLATLELGPSKKLCIGYRRNFSDTPSLYNGLYLSWAYNEAKTRLLDMNPSQDTSKEDMLDAGLQISKSFTDPTGGINIEPLAQGGSGSAEWIDVRVRLGPLDNDPPSLELTLPDEINAREYETYTANATDPENDPVSILWNFGYSDQTSSDSSLSFAYPIGGNFQLSVSASDGEGNYVKTASTLFVNDPLEPWTEISEESVSGNIVSVNFTNDHFYVTAGETIFKSKFGYHWVALLPGITTLDTAAIGNTLVAIGTSSDENAPTESRGEISMSTDDGKTWQKETLPGNTPALEQVENGNNTCLALGSLDTLLRKSGQGPWERLQAPWSNFVTSLIYSEGAFFATEWNGALYRTDDNAETWTDITAKLGATKIDRLESGDGMLLAIDGTTSYLSSDNGETWTRGSLGMENANDFYLIFLACSSDLHIVQGLDFSDNGSSVVFYSTDGISWVPYRKGLHEGELEAAFGNSSLIIAKPGSLQISNAIHPDFSRWMTKRFPDANPIDFAPHNDSDSDGIPDFGEYAFDLDPSTKDSGVTARTYALSHESGFRIQARPIDPSVSFVCHISTDLETWTPVTLEFHRETGNWSLNSNLLEISAAIPDSDGAWELSIRKTETAPACFARFSARYDSH